MQSIGTLDKLMFFEPFFNFVIKAEDALRVTDKVIATQR
jgi:hypothetical protein